MERVEDEVVSIVGPPMAGDDFSATADHNLVYISADQNVPMTVGHRDRIVIGPVSDQGQRTDPRRVLVSVGNQHKWDRLGPEKIIIMKSCVGAP